jgi:hypothetical protein
MAEGGRPDKAEGFVLFREPKCVWFQMFFAQAFGSAGLGMGEGGGRGITEITVNETYDREFEPLHKMTFI